MKDKIIPLLCLLAAAGVQANLPGGFHILGSGPDLVLVVLIVFSLAGNPSSGAILGFAAGMIEGSSVGTSLGSFIITRTIVGFIAGVTTNTFFSENPIVSVFSAAWLTLIAEAMFAIANPAASFLEAARRITGECVWNSLLSLLLVYILKYVQTKHKIRMADIRGRF